MSEPVTPPDPDAFKRWSSALAPSLDDFAAIADAAFQGLPQPFRAIAGEVVLQVADFADDDVLDDLGIEDPFELTGLYQGLDLQHRSVLDGPPVQTTVFLFRRPILDEWIERSDVTLGDLIAHVVVHEIGHHFGLTDEQMHQIEARA
jgi:predicted Zn-dependent protease with MMP-like domain